MSPHRLLRGSIAGVVLLLACSSEPVAVKTTGGEQVAAEPPGVLLDFKWPAGLHARVGVEVREDSATGPLAGAASYELSTAPTAEGLRIDFHDLRVLQPFAMGELPAPVVEQLVQLRPALLVDSHGALTGLLDVEQRIAQALNALRAEPAFVDLLRRRATPASLAEDAARAWHDLVEFWAGERLEPGRSYWIRSAAPLPLLAGEEVELVTTYRIQPGLPCDEYDPARACVLLTILVEPDPASLLRAVQRLNRAAIDRAEGKNLQLVTRIDHVELSTQLELLTEPATLLPRRLTRVRRSLKQYVEETQPLEERKLHHEQHRYQYLKR